MYYPYVVYIYIYVYIHHIIPTFTKQMTSTLVLKSSQLCEGCQGLLHITQRRILLLGPWAARRWDTPVEHGRTESSYMSSLSNHMYIYIYIYICVCVSIYIYHYIIMYVYDMQQKRKQSKNEGKEEKGRKTEMRLDDFLYAPDERNFS